MTDWSWFFADDWKVSPNLTLNPACVTMSTAFRPRGTASSRSYDYPAALATGNVQDGFVFASNFDPESVPGAAGLELHIAEQQEQSSRPDYNNFMPRVELRVVPLPDTKVVIRGGYGIFYERITGAFANSLRQGPPFFRELQLNDAGNWNTIPNDVPTFPVPDMSVGIRRRRADSGGDNDPDTEFEAFETQMVSPDLVDAVPAPVELHHAVGVPAELVARGGLRRQQGQQAPAVGEHAIRRWTSMRSASCRAPAFPAADSRGNYYDIDDDEFVNLDTPPPGCDRRTIRAIA